MTSPFLSSWTSGFVISLAVSCNGTIGPARMSIDGGSTHEERRASVHDVEDIGLFYVDLNVAVLDAAVGLDFIGAVAGNQQRRFSKLVEHLLAIDVGRSALAHLGGLARSLHHHQRRKRGHAQYYCSHLIYFLLRKLRFQSQRLKYNTLHTRCKQSPPKLQAPERSPSSCPRSEFTPGIT